MGNLEKPDTVLRHLEKWTKNSVFLGSVMLEVHRSLRPLCLPAYCQPMDTEPFLLKGVLRRKGLIIKHWEAALQVEEFL